MHIILTSPRPIHPATKPKPHLQGTAAVVANATFQCHVSNVGLPGAREGRHHAHSQRRVGIAVVDLEVDAVARDDHERPDVALHSGVNSLQLRRVGNRQPGPCQVVARLDGAGLKVDTALREIIVAVAHIALFLDVFLVGNGSIAEAKLEHTRAVLFLPQVCKVEVEAVVANPKDFSGHSRLRVVTLLVVRSAIPGPQMSDV